MSIAVAAFYKFVPIDDAEILRARLMEVCDDAGVKGTVLIATEGINGTISAETGAMQRVLAVLRSDSRFANLITKDATTDVHELRIHASWLTSLEMITT